MPKSQLRQQLNLSPAVEDYLKAIYQLRESHLQAGNDEPRVTTNALAAALAVAPGSVTGMVKKLADADLVNHRPYYGVELTELGERLALELVRHHRLLELYLTNVVGFRWDEVHEQADALEHAISEEFEDRIAHLLGEPLVDPHGDPIPTKEGYLRAPQLRPLSEIAPAPERSLRLARVTTQAPDMLRYLQEQGLTPGAEVRVLGREPFGGPMRLRVGDAATERIIGAPVLDVLWVVADSSEAN